MSTNRIKIGVITANFNGKEFFDDYIKGIESQTYKPDYVLLVDDASTDESFENWLNFFNIENQGKSLYKTFKFGIEFVITKNEKNIGPAFSRNVALHYLMDKVDILLVADSDDILYPNKVQRSIDIFKKYPDVGLVYSDYDHFDQKTGKVVREYKEIFSFNRLFQECIVSNNSAYRSSIIKQVGLYDENLKGPEDYDLWLRICEKSMAYHIPESLYKYRISGNNLTVRTNPMKFAEQVNIVHQKALERRKHAR